MSTSAKKHAKREKGEQQEYRFYELNIKTTCCTCTAGGGDYDGVCESVTENGKNELRFELVKKLLL